MNIFVLFGSFLQCACLVMCIPKWIEIAIAMPSADQNRSIMFTIELSPQLPVFSKGLEKLNYDRILAFVKENHMIYNVQFGIREVHYTSNALILITDRISKSFYNGEWPWVFPLYFDTAFDMINYETFCWEVLSCMVSQALFMIGWTAIYRIGPYIFYRWC